MKSVILMQPRWIIIFSTEQLFQDSGGFAQTFVGAPAGILPGET